MWGTPMYMLKNQGGGLATLLVSNIQDMLCFLFQILISHSKGIHQQQSVKSIQQIPKLLHLGNIPPGAQAGSSLRALPSPSSFSLPFMLPLLLLSWMKVGRMLATLPTIFALLKVKSNSLLFSGKNFVLGKGIFFLPIKCAYILSASLVALHEQFKKADPNYFFDFGIGIS